MSRHGGGNGAGPALHEQAYEALKRKILSLELRPGERLTEGALSRAVGIGRMPVHQALHRLGAEGFLEIQPRRGIRVREIAPGEATALLEARGGIESLAASLAAGRAGPAQIEAMAALLRRSAELLARRRVGRGRVWAEFMNIDIDFHRLVAEATGNRFLVDMHRVLHEQLVRFWRMQVWNASDLARTQAQHERILDAIARGDAPRAAKAVQIHFGALSGRAAGPEEKGRTGRLTLPASPRAPRPTRGAPRASTGRRDRPRGSPTARATPRSRSRGRS